jgi:hypothetical protein
LRTGSAGYARLAEINHLWMPTVAQIQAYTSEAIELQEALRGISESFDHQLPAVDTQA